MELQLFQSQSQVEVASKLEAWGAMEPTIQEAIDRILEKGKGGEIVVANDEERTELHKVISEANRTKKAYQDQGMEVRRPINDLSKAIINHDKIVTQPLDEAIEACKKAIKSYDQKKEEERLKELARLEELRLQREAKEREERQRVQKHEDNLREFQAKCDQVLRSEDLESLDWSPKEPTKDGWEEFLPQAQAIVSDFEKARSERVAFLKQQAEAKAEAERLASENKEAAAALLKMQQEKAKAEQEAREAEAAARRAKEQAEAEQRKLEAEAQQRREEEVARLEAEEKKAQLEKQRIKGVTSGIEEISLLDICQVPDHLYEVKWKMAEVKAYLKKNESIPGATVKLKSKLILNAK